ncbi:MAG TPA: bis(5'-nucleosyl)-tetraphosphatase (symmetrical) YqeK [Bacillota bacterium]|nr:bis(5'-nucleosyl)-tetraphosphatase (symmetrical) YqeK [Bacillota bacterium]
MTDTGLILSIEDYLKDAFKNKPSRLQHIYNVKKVAITLGNIYHVDIPSVIVASYLHDATKMLSDEENIALAGDLFPKDQPPACAHAYAAAKVAQTTFKIDDQDILNAIMYHCSGRKNMSTLEKVIFVSDFIEEGREFPNSKVRLLAHQHLDRALYEVMILTKKYITDSNQKLSSLTEEAIKYYQKEVEGLND